MNGTRAPIFAGLPRPLLFAHRGASAQAPENTFDAFDVALRLGAQVLEMDVHLTADGEVVVLHDATLERTTNGTGLVASKTYAELRALDAGCKFTTAKGVRLFADRQVVIPRLADVLAAFPAGAYNIELKSAQPQLVNKVLQICKVLPPERLVLAAAADGIMRGLEAAPSQVPLGMSAGQVMRAYRSGFWGRAPRGFAGRALQIPPRYCGLPLASARLVRTMQRAGLQVHLWTLNTAVQARAYLRRGIDGIMSDDPGQLLQAVQDQRAS